MKTEQAVAARKSASRALDVLYKTEDRLSKRFALVVNILKPPARVKSLLVQTQKRPGSERFKRLWHGAAEIAAKFHFKRRGTDWVFENFWPNAKEPKHSKLLAFFLDPQEHHECGRFLLEKLLPILETAARESRRGNSSAEPRFVAEGCIVKPESGGYIDLRIERERAAGKFAIIIENKINNAPDQSGYRESVKREAGQLERCVEHLKRRRFRPDEIFVFYLPLEGSRDARPEDIAAITREGVTYAQITFRYHIREWLEAALKDWQQPNEDLREHLSYYQRLITYLVNKNKQNEMDSEILKCIQMEEEAGFLTLSDIDAACNSAAALKRVFERVLRGRLLRRIHEDLRKGDLRPNFYATESPRLVCPTSDYANEFENEIVVGVEVNDAIAVGCGWDEEGFFFAYVRLHSDQGQYDDVVQGKAREELGDIKPQESSCPYYAYKYEPVTYQECQEEKTAADKAIRIREMRESLQQALR